VVIYILENLSALLPKNKNKNCTLIRNFEYSNRLDSVLLINIMQRNLYKYLYFFCISPTDLYLFIRIELKYIVNLDEIGFWIFFLVIVDALLFITFLHTFIFRCSTCVSIYIYTRKYFSNIISLKSNMNKQTYLLFGITIQM
jgi:hypothetical protein